MTDVLHDAPPAVDLDFEREALGVLLVNERVPLALSEGLSADDFFREAHRQMFRAAVDLEQRGVRAEFTSVAEELRRRNQYDQPAYYWSLTDYRGRPDDAQVVYLVSRLRELATARRLRSVLAEASEELSAGRDIADRAAELIARIEAARASIAVEHRALNPYAQCEALLTELTRDKGEAIDWGFPGLDAQVPGIYPGEVFGLMARPGIGKTLLLNHLTRHVAPLGHVFFSLEMPAAQIAARMARSVYGYTRAQLEDAAREDRLDTGRYLEAANGLLLVDTPGLSVAQMDGLIRQMVVGPMRGTPLRLVTIDHLGLIGGDRSLSTYDRVSCQARELKELAKRHKVAVLVAIQVNREQGGDGSRELTLGSARDSGVVEEAVDYLVALRRLDRSREATAETRLKYRDVVFARVLKNRHSTLGDEIAIRLNGVDLTLDEDPMLRAEDADLSRDLYQTRGRRR